MNKHNVLVLFFVIFLTNNVSCDDAEEVKQRGLIRARQKYRYNHPPEPENYENIPVAIVYDKVIDRTNRGRNVKPTKETNHATSIAITKNVPEEFIISGIKSEEKVTTESVLNNDALLTEKEERMKNLRKAEPRKIKLEYKIPVSVVYDEEPGIVRRNRIKSGVSTRIRKPIKKQQQTANSESSKQTEPTLNESDLKPVSPIIEKDSSENLKQEEKSKIKVISSKQEDTNFVSTQISDTNTTDENQSEKRRIHGNPDPIVPIVASENRVFGHNGEFKYSYEGGDGTKAFSKGQLRTFDEEVAGEAVEGGFSYKDKDGNDFSLSYTADENGYRPVGAHLPTPPPIPLAIARALAYLATKTTPEPVTEPLDVEENTPVLI